jgi:hypothetical protein
VICSETLRSEDGASAGTGGRGDSGRFDAEIRQARVRSAAAIRRNTVARSSARLLPGSGGGRQAGRVNDDPVERRELNRRKR